MNFRSKRTWGARRKSPLFGRFRTRAPGERVEEITSVSTKRAREFQTPLGRFTYRPVNERVFSYGVRLEQDEVRTQLVPIPYQVRIYTRPCLFAGKLHAILCRNWKSRVKGRDFYDLVWYLGRATPVALAHLRQRMEQTGHWEPSVPFDLEQLKHLLRNRFDAVDFAQAKDDVRPFVRDPGELALWSREFFSGLMDRLQGK